MAAGTEDFERGPTPAAASTVPAMLARACARRPGAPAVEAGGRVLTYAELSARASALAGRLRPLVEGADPVVALLLGRGPEFVVAMLGAWRAGCAFSPIDPATPVERLRYFLDDLGARAVITDDPTRLPADTAVPVLDTAGGVGEPGADREPGPDDVAYVLYTSGTTGAPKGVAIAHGGLGNRVAWCVGELGLGPDDRSGQLANVGFDAAQLETWPALASGGCLVASRDPVAAAELAEWLDGRAVTRAFLATPLAEALWADPDAPTRLRSLLIGAAALTRRPPPLPYPVWNLYGPTECAIFATAHRLGGDGPLNAIGRPIPGTHAYVLAENGDRVPVGAPGEIHLGGIGVGLGYWRRPALTGRRFTGSDPDGRPDRVYRTGDRGRWLPDGTLEYLGRTDQQIALRGYRIEPGEIETRLRADPLVRAALVRAVGNRLVAYLVPPTDAERDTAGVLARLNTWLPEHMVPDAVLWLDELPLTERGKVDDARLPRPDRAASAGPLVPPAGEMERRVARVWARVLGVETVGSHDNFFDIGGSSLLLMNLRSELRAEFGVALPIQRLFEHTTVRALARSLAEGPAGDDAGDLSARERAARAREARARRRR